MMNFDSRSINVVSVLTFNTDGLLLFSTAVFIHGPPDGVQPSFADVDWALSTIMTHKRWEHDYCFVKMCRFSANFEEPIGRWNLSKLEQILCFCCNSGSERADYLSSHNASIITGSVRFNQVALDSHDIMHNADGIVGYLSSFLNTGS